MPFPDLSHLWNEAKESTRAVLRAELWRMLKPSGLVRVVPELLHGGLSPSSIYRLHGKGLADVPAIVDGARIWSYADLNRDANRLADTFANAGVAPGDKVLAVLPNCAAFLLVQAACAKLRAACVPVSYRLTSAELAYILRDARPKLAVFDSTLAAVVMGAKPEEAGVTGLYAVGEHVPGAQLFDDALLCGADREPSRSKTEPELILYTSGTTGRPKGAVRAFKGSSVLQLIHLLRMIPMRHGDRHLVAGPLYHALPGGFATVNLGLGGTLVLMAKFGAEAFLAAVQRHQITSATAVPTMLRELCNLPADVRARYDLSSLRVIVVGGAALEHPLVRDFSALYGDHLLYNLYGATELGWVTVAGPKELLDKPHTIGRAVPGCQITLEGKDGAAVPDGEVGELFVCSELLIRGYHQNDAATAKSRRGAFFTVGDLARRDADGFYFLAGRKVDMVISGGVNIYPAEIEAALLEHEDIVDVAVIGVADERFGEALRAFVVLSAGAVVEEDAFVAYLRDRLAGYKIPRQWRFVDALPRNPTGKVLKRELREHP